VILVMLLLGDQTWTSAWREDTGVNTLRCVSICQVATAVPVHVDTAPPTTHLARVSVSRPSYFLLL